jgi:hemerythrin-like domain-containing protein
MAEDFISVLTTDHGEIKDYFRQLEAATDGESRRRIADELTSEVVKHSVAEEMFLYPAARRILDDGDALVDEELEEHAEAEELLKRWEGMDGDDPEFMSVYQQVKEGLLHHIDEEEEPKLFPQLREKMDQGEMEKMGAAIQQAKKLAPTRPHPKAPDHPPMDAVVGVPTGVIDRIRDAMSGRSTS